MINHKGKGLAIKDGEVKHNLQTANLKKIIQTFKMCKLLRSAFK